MLEIIDRNSRRLLGLIEDLLTISLVDTGEFVLELGRVNVRDLVGRVMEATAPAAAASGLELVADVDADEILKGDPMQLERALRNLVSNSVKFSPAGGRIVVRTRTLADTVTISVSDTGPGVPTDEQSDLFTRFFRTARSQDQEAPGTGLGLYIVKQIVDLHGGNVEVESSEMGSTFGMRLPIVGPIRGRAYPNGGNPLGRGESLDLVGEAYRDDGDRHLAVRALVGDGVARALAEDRHADRRVRREDVVLLVAFLDRADEVREQSSSPL